MFSVELGSVPEMKCETKCHQSPMYRSGKNVLNALLHPNFNPYITHSGADFDILYTPSFATRDEACGQISMKLCV